MCGLLGLSIPLQPVLAYNSPAHHAYETEFTGDVLIIGTGAAGLTAGHLLRQQNVDFQIIEATSVYGGRMKITKDFVDFPIPLGAEWLHTKRAVFTEVVNNPSVEITTETIPYNPKIDYGLFEVDKISLRS